MSISVVILTLNEEANLQGALDSLNSLCTDVVVFDSFSADHTAEIASRNGARVVQHEFVNYGAQRNAALTQVSFKYPWVLMLDADERVTPALWSEMCGKVESASKQSSLFRMRRKDFFMGRWLKRSSGYPTWFGRLMRVGAVHVEREINEEYITNGEIGYIHEHLIHFPFNRGIAHWFDRHNHYSTAEAKRLIFETKVEWQVSDLLSVEPIKRRKALKQLAFRSPSRPTLAFIYLYVIRLGMLDGIAGFHFCRMRAIYEYMIDLKVYEARHASRWLPPSK